MYIYIGTCMYSIAPRFGSNMKPEFCHTRETSGKGEPAAAQPRLNQQPKYHRTSTIVPTNIP